MSNALCAAFSKASVDMWHRIQEGRSLHWLGEETLTDLLIRDLLRLQLPGFEITVFDKGKEGKNGADWEWWFQGISGKWLGMRIQAKVISKEAHRFEHLHYPAPKKSKPRHKQDEEFYQCDKLITRSEYELDFPRVPVYMLYCHWSSLPQKPIEVLDWVTDYNESILGCSVMAAKKVKELRTSSSGNGGKKLYRRSLYDVAQHLCPLQFLTCHSFGITGGSIAERIEEGLKVVGAIDRGSQVQYLLDSPPPSIAQLIDSKSMGASHSKYTALESRETDNLKGRLVFSQTGIRN